MKPIQQVIELVLDDIPEFQSRKPIIENELATLKETLPEDKYDKKRESLRYKEVNRILFDEFIKK
jgi:hypothetical protein